MWDHVIFRSPRISITEKTLCNKTSIYESRNRK